MKRILVPVVAFLTGAALMWTVGLVAQPAVSPIGKGAPADIASRPVASGRLLAMVPGADDAKTKAGDGVVSGRVIAARDAERRVSPSGKARVTLLAQGRNAFTGILEMDPGAAVPEHQDASEEYIYILEGSGTLTMDGVAHEVGPGTLIFMPGNAHVSYQNGPNRMVAFQVFAGPGSARKYDAWAVVPASAHK